MRGHPETVTAAGSVPPPAAQPLPSSGEVIDKKYRVERVLGRGGMGAVLLVVHEHLGTRHALQVLAGDAWKDEAWKTRFFREALKTPDALYFDGSVSSLWDPADSRQDSHAPLGPIIVAFKPAK